MTMCFGLGTLAGRGRWPTLYEDDERELHLFHFSASDARRSSCDQLDLPMSKLDSIGERRQCRVNRWLIRWPMVGIV